MKFFNNKAASDIELNKTIDNVISYISEKLNFENIRIISDRESTEIVSGREVTPKDNEVVVELLIRKHIIINNDDFKDRDSLDKHISKIKHFCQQAKSIEDLKYLQIGRAHV